MKKKTLRFMVISMVLIAAIGVICGLLYIDNIRWKEERSTVDEVIQQSEFDVRTKDLVAGMSEAEVIDIMGEPVERWTPKDHGHFEVALFYTMKTSNDAIMIGFTDDKYHALGPMRNYTNTPKADTESITRE